MAKSAAPISNDKFLTDAPTLTLKVGNEVLEIEPRTFGSGSVGLGYNGKVKVPVDGVKVLCQVSISITMIGSKDQADQVA